MLVLILLFVLSAAACGGSHRPGTGGAAEEAGGSARQGGQSGQSGSAGQAGQSEFGGSNGQSEFGGSNGQGGSSGQSGQNGSAGQTGQNGPAGQGTAAERTGAGGEGEEMGSSLRKADPPVDEINAWGDSITEGYGGFGVSYPDVLEELTGIPVNNFGTGGEDSLEIMTRCISYGSQTDDVMIMQMGDNGGWVNMDDLIAQYRRMIEVGGTDRYIIISSTDDPDDFVQIWGYTHSKVGLDDTWYERRLREAFGDHLLIGRKYLIENGLRVNGLRETEEDRIRAEKGDISLQLRNTEIDNTHLNAAGYTALAYGVYERGSELGYW